MKCPVCNSHATSFTTLFRSERQFYMMPFVRSCPHCGAKIRFGARPLACFLGLLFFLHSSIEVSAVIARRWGVDRDNAFLYTTFVFLVPFSMGLYFLWKYGRYMLR